MYILFLNLPFLEMKTTSMEGYLKISKGEYLRNHSMDLRGNFAENFECDYAQPSLFLVSFVLWVRL